MELSSSNIKEILIFSQKKAFLIFSQKKVFLVFSQKKSSLILSTTDLRELFYSQALFTLHSFLTFGTTCFYQGFPGAGSSSLKVAGPPTEVRNTDPAHLSV